MQSFEFDGRKYTYPERLTNRRVIEVQALAGEEGHWFLDAERLPKMMRLILEGDHDGVDWLDQDSALTLEVYRGFFDYWTKKIAG